MVFPGKPIFFILKRFDFPRTIIIGASWIVPHPLRCPSYERLNLFYYSKFNFIHAGLWLFAGAIQC
jgi:hypothetical protein